MIYDLIIVGGGPAGITAGIYAARKKVKTLLLTSDFVGQTGKALHVENYPGFKSISGNELLQRFIEHLRQFEIETREQEAVEVKKTDQGFKIITKDNGSFATKAIIIASGRSPRMLNVVGEEEFIGKGVSYCPLCDAAFFKDKRVIVVGGGNSGFGAAMELIRYASKAFIFEFAPQVRADEIIQEQAKASGKIEVFLNVQLKEIKGKGKVESVVYRNHAEKKEYEMPIEGVFVEIGSVPASNLVKELVDFSETGDVKIDPWTCQTRTPGVFAAGDITNIRHKQIIIAAAEGAKAALSAHEYLEHEKQN